MRSVLGRYGEVWFYGKDEYVGRSLYNYGEFSPEECEKIISLAVRDKLCLDIGANVGCISQALVYNDFSVVCFEPQPELFALLGRNVVPAVKYNVALADYNGFTKMPRIRYGSKGNYGGVSCGTTSVLGCRDVPVTTLDSFGFVDVGFIKIDVEGFEEKVLAGGIQTILENKPIMYIEDDRVEKSASLRKYISGLGYTIEEHKPPLYRENNYFGLKKNIWDKYYVSHNLICRPIC